jgi:hypothetical protein
MEDREVGTVNVIVAVDEEKSHAPLINLEIRISKFERSPQLLKGKCPSIDYLRLFEPAWLRFTRSR